MKIYTRQGDRGDTKLHGGATVPKSDRRVVAYGSLDELSAVLGVVRSLDAEDSLGTGALEDVQEDLLVIGAYLASDQPGRARERGLIPTFRGDRVTEMEGWIDRLDAELSPLDAFVLPGGSPTGAQLHVARTVCRRAERAIVDLLPDHPELSEEVVPYINRLSDLLFMLARAVNQRAGRTEPRWLPMRERQGDSAPPAGDNGDPQ